MQFKWRGGDGEKWVGIGEDGGGGGQIVFKHVFASPVSLVKGSPEAWHLSVGPRTVLLCARKLDL